MDKNIAIKVENVNKVFRIPHNKISSIRGAFVNLFHKNIYEEFEALKGVSFKVKKGEFFGIIGRNGSGKSTLLKILAGIYQADSGKVHINGLISPFLELGIGFNPELSGRDNIYLNATVLGLTRKQIDHKFNDIVAFSELERFIDQKLKNYSSGMQVRLAFSVAIHANRDILLMDEVLAVGDTNFQSKCLEEFNKYREMGKTVVLVSHDLYTIQKYCDRVMLVRNGKVIKIGNAAEVTGEYLRENISDQENRLAGERKSADKKDSTGKTFKIAEVADVKFKDARDNDKNVFETGETIRIDIFYRINEKIKNPIFGITIRDGMKNNVYALNTQYKKMQTGEIETGIRKVSFLIDNFFATGSYSISPAIATELGMMIDLLDNAATVRVVNPEFSSKALADFKTEIII